MNTLKPHLIPILLISVQIINSIVYYMFDMPSVFFSITMIVYVIAFVGKIFELTRNFLPYWHSLYLDAPVYHVARYLLLVGVLVTIVLDWNIETFPSSSPISYTIILIFVYWQRREPLSEKSDVE